MCGDPLERCGKRKVFGWEECKSPFGIYELKIPVDSKLSCDVTGSENTNCKDLDVSKMY